MLKLPIIRVHRLLRHPQIFFDVVHTRDAIGRPTSTQEPDRTLLAGVQPAGNDVVKMLPEGQQKDGALVVHCTARLFIASGENDEQENERQTYLRRPDGTVWKAWKEQNWNPHSGIWKGYFTKYVDIDGNVA